jgi:hypothetical protein
VELVRSILAEGVEQGIFSAEIDIDECALLLYYLVHSALSNDPNLFRRPGQPEVKIDARTLVRLLGRGILARDAG